MKSGDYLCALSAALSDQVNDQTRRDILRYYGDYFDAVGPAGVGAVAEELGDPFVLAASLAAEGGFSAETGPRVLPASLRRANRAAAAVVSGLLAGCVLLVLLQWAVRGRSPGPADVCAADEAFRSVRVEIAVGDVELRSGEDFGVTLDWDRERPYSMNAVVEEGVLRVTSDTAPGPALGAGAFEAKVVVTVPPGTALDSVELETDHGAVRADDVQAMELDLNASLGAVAVRDCQIGRALTAESDVGDVELHGALTCATRLKSGLGAVRVCTHTAEDDCAYVLECGMGALDVDGQHRECKLEKRDGAIALNCTSTMGDVSVAFGED